MAVLSEAFYARDPILVAQQLLGKRLVRRSREGTTAGRIVEVEAYLSKADLACHAARGRTRSNAAMFGPAGRAYVYPIHSRYCFNTVTETHGVPSAVLIRAVEPLEGLRLMEHRRRRGKVAELARGPARLCEAFAIDRRLDHWDLTRGNRLWIDDTLPALSEALISRSVRIGVTAAHENPLRFFVAGNSHVSGPQRLNRSGAGADDSAKA
jgi:DNA-3-methyladenine glycosylase